MRKECIHRTVGNATSTRYMSSAVATVKMMTFNVQERSSSNFMRIGYELQRYVCLYEVIPKLLSYLNPHARQAHVVFIESFCIPEELTASKSLQALCGPYFGEIQS